MAKPVTFEFEGKTYVLPDDIVKQYEDEVHNDFFSFHRNGAHKRLTGDLNPFMGKNNPYDKDFLTEQWYRRELKGLEWFEAAADRLRKYAFSWRWYFRPWWKPVLISTWLMAILATLIPSIIRLFN